MVVWGRGISYCNCLHTKLVVRRVQEAKRRRYCCCLVVVIIIIIVISIISTVIILPAKHCSEANWKCGN